MWIVVDERVLSFVVLIAEEGVEKVLESTDLVNGCLLLLALISRR